MQKRGEKEFIAPASLYKRFTAFLIDVIILNFIVLFPFRRIIENLIPENIVFSDLITLLQSSSAADLLFRISVASSIIIILYFTYFEYKIQQTPGKMMVGLSIISEKKDNLLMNVLLSNVIFLMFIPLIVILWAVELVYLLTSPKHQRLTEKMAGIVVVQKYKAG